MMIAVVAATAFAMTGFRVAALGTTRILLTVVRALTSRLIFAGFQLTHHRGRLRQIAIAAAPFRTILPSGTIATNVLALEQGASIFRVHDVARVADALQVAAATLAGRWPPTTT